MMNEKREFMSWCENPNGLVNKFEAPERKRYFELDGVCFNDNDSLFIGGEVKRLNRCYNASATCWRDPNDDNDDVITVTFAESARQPFYGNRDKLFVPRVCSFREDVDENIASPIVTISSGLDHSLFSVISNQKFVIAPKANVKKNKLAHVDKYIVVTIRMPGEKDNVGIVYSTILPSYINYFAKSFYFPQFDIFLTVSEEKASRFVISNHEESDKRIARVDQKHRRTNGNMSITLYTQEQSLVNSEFIYDVNGIRGIANIDSSLDAETYIELCVDGKIVIKERVDVEKLLISAIKFRGTNNGRKVKLSFSIHETHIDNCDEPEDKIKVTNNSVIISTVKNLQTQIQEKEALIEKMTTDFEKTANDLEGNKKKSVMLEENISILRLKVDTAKAINENIKAEKIIETEDREIQTKLNKVKTTQEYSKIIGSVFTGILSGITVVKAVTELVKAFSTKAALMESAASIGLGGLLMVAATTVAGYLSYNLFKKRSCLIS